MTIDDKCTHPVVTLNGIQEGYGYMADFRLGDCCICKSSISMDDSRRHYEPVYDLRFNGKMVYYNGKNTK
jgi:hypothetical protein